VRSRNLATLTGILDNRDLLNEPARRLPSHLRKFEREQIDFGEALVGIGDRAEGAERGGHRPADVFPCGFILIMDRLATPWQLIPRHPRGRT
jgi:hypothetical protein